MRRALSVCCVLAVLTACSDGVVEPQDSAPGPAALPSRAPAVAAAPPTPSPSPSPTLPPGPDRSALVARLDEATRAFGEDAAVSLAVVDAEGRVVFSLGGDEPLLPASTAKLLPGAAALQLFGPEHRFETVVDAVGELTEDGVLHGRLELVGGGEPALDTDVYRSYVYIGRPHARLEDLADLVVEAGIDTVTNGLVAGPDAFGDTPEAPGWKPGYLAVLDARRITALTVDAGLAVTLLAPAPDPQLELLSSADPQARAVADLGRMLAERGVTVWPVSRALPAARTRVATLAGPPLLEHLTFAFERSDNHTADMLLRSVGADAGATDWLASGRVVADVLAELGVDTDGMVLADGSGLSRDDRVTALQLAHTDRVMRAGPHAAAWREALAVAGEEGTLRRRLRGTVAEGRFLGKTGTLDDVTAIAGTVEGPDGAAAFHMAGIVNLPRGAGSWLDRLVMDDVIALLAEDAAGCARVAPPQDLPSEQPVVGGLYVGCPAEERP